MWVLFSKGHLKVYPKAMRWNSCSSSPHPAQKEKTAAKPQPDETLPGQHMPLHRSQFAVDPGRGGGSRSLCHSTWGAVPRREAGRTGRLSEASGFHPICTDAALLLVSLRLRTGGGLLRIIALQNAGSPEVNSCKSTLCDNFRDQCGSVRSDFNLYLL